MIFLWRNREKMFSNVFERFVSNVFHVNAATPASIKYSNPDPGLFLKQFNINVQPRLQMAHDAFNKLHVASKNGRFIRADHVGELKRKLQECLNEEEESVEKDTPTELAEYLDQMYCDFKLTIVQKNFIQFVMSIYGARFNSHQRAQLELIITSNFDNFFLIFLYLIYNITASHRIEFNNQQKRIRTIPIKDNSVQHLAREVHISTTTYRLHVNFLLPS